MKRQTSTDEKEFSTTISSRGQMVLPSRMRKKLGLRKGMRLRLVIQGDTEQTILVQPIRPEAIEQLRGSVPGAADALDYLQKERKRDRERGR